MFTFTQAFRNVLLALLTLGCWHLSNLLENTCTCGQEDVLVINAYETANSRKVPREYYFHFSEKERSRKHFHCRVCEKRNNSYSKADFEIWIKMELFPFIYRAISYIGRMWIWLFQLKKKKKKGKGIAEGGGLGKWSGGGVQLSGTDAPPHYLTSLLVRGVQPFQTKLEHISSLIIIP